MAKTDNKIVSRRKRIQRIRKKISGTSERPRLRVFKSSRHIYAQVIDDSTGQTLTAVSSLHAEVVGAEAKSKTDKAKKVGELIAQRAKEKGVEKVVFDRGGNLYHGRVKALSEAARESGLLF